MRSLTVKTLAIVATAAVAACARVDQLQAPPAPSTSQNESAALAFVPFAANLTQSTPGAVPAPLGLKACFAGESNALDVVSNNVGTLNGTAGYIAGRFGNAFNFLALNDGVSIPSSASLNFGGASGGITMAAWVYGRGTMFQPGSGIVGAGPIIEYDNGPHLWHHSQDGDPQAIFTNIIGAGGTSADWHILQIPGVASLNAWHHAAATYSKATGEVKLYVDGVQVGVMNGGTFNPNTGTTLHIGRRATPVIGDPDYTFNGAIDEVQIYDRGLTAAEIAQIAGATGTMCVPPPASYKVEQMPVGSGESGVPFTTQPVVAILDANGNVVSNATTPVTVTVTSGTGTLLGTTTVNAVNGYATFTNLAIAGAGSTTIGFTAGALPPLVGSPTVSGALPTVQVPRQLGVVTQPGGANSGAALAPQPVVEIRDAAGLRVPGATNSVTATIGSGVGVIGGTTTVAAVNGTATFGNISVVGAGPTGTTSATFTTAGPPASQTAVFTQPSSTTESGFAIPAQPVIEVRDALGNRATAATGTVTASIATGTGVAVAGTVTAPIVNGLATFSGLKVNGVGTVTLRFTLGALPAVTSTPVAVTQVVRQLVQVAGPSTITDGVVISPPFAVELRDAAGIKVATSTFLVRMGIGVLPGTLTGVNEVNAVAGVATFPNMIADTDITTIFFNFWVIDPAAGAILPYVQSGNVTVLANNTNPPPTFTWTGFFDPIDNLPKVNKNEGGSTIPIKFSLGGDKGLEIFAAGYPASQQASCTNFAPTGSLIPIKVTGSWGNDDDDDDDYEYDHDYSKCKDKSKHKDHRHKKSSSSNGWQKSYGSRSDGRDNDRDDDRNGRGDWDDDWRDNRKSDSHSSSNDARIAGLKYSNGKYQINWKTEKSWDGTCRILVVKLVDGTEKKAHFKFK